ncbi:MAG: ATP-binding protein, partial [Desulfomonilaceae bacterium]
MTEILGHSETLGVLEKSAHSKRQAHSYLFSGVDGIGKKLVAIEFACMLNCPSYTYKQPHSCRICDQIRKNAHADVRIERPQKGTIRIDTVRQLQGFLKYSPIEALYRVIIIDDAHLTNRAAQNALLKTLEEPPSNSIIILITSKASSLLPTVRSRLRRIKFAPLQKSLIAAELVRSRGLSREQAESLAGIASGSLGRAFELLSANYLKFRRDLTDFLTKGQNYGLSALLDLSFRVSADAQLLSDVIEFGITWIRDLFVLKVTGETRSIVNTDLVDILTISAQHLSEYELLAIHDQMSNTLG